MINWNECLPTPEMRADFERFKLLSPEERKHFKKEVQDKYNKLSEEEKAAYKEASEAGLNATIKACNDFINRADEAILRDKLGELPEAISFSYIAKKYFGKSRNWLYQRINGYNVNGKRAHFTENEFQTFQNALKDISAMINQTSLKLG